MSDTINFRNVRNCSRVRGRVFDSARFRSHGWAVVALTAPILGFVSSLAHSDQGAAAAAGPLRVVALATAPFVLPDTDPPTGFSVDIWNEVARRMHVNFT